MRSFINQILGFGTNAEAFISGKMSFTPPVEALPSSGQISIRRNSSRYYSHAGPPDFSQRQLGPIMRANGNAVELHGCSAKTCSSEPLRSPELHDRSNVADASFGVTRKRRICRQSTLVFGGAFAKARQLMTGDKALKEQSTAPPRGLGAE
jgi:hypothetical protein